MNESERNQDTGDTRALEGVKVLEYCSRVSGPYCTKIMADFGAEVIKIEPPGVGDAARTFGPFAGDEPDPEKSGFFLYLNTNKRGLTLDPSRPEGRDIFLKLVREADVLIEDRPPGEMNALGLGYRELEEINPGLVMASLTPYGLSGPYKNYKAYNLNTSHVSGQGYLLPLVSPNRQRPPVKVGGYSSAYDPGMVLVLAVLAALFHKGLSGRGQFIELSKQEALISMQRVESVTFANDGVFMERTGRRNRMPGGVLPCKNGHVVIITPEDHQWEALLKLIGEPDWSREDWCRDRRLRAERADEINEYLTEWTMQYTKEEIFRMGQALSCPVSPLHTAQDQVESEQLAAREFFQENEHPAIGRVKFPTTPYRFSESPWRLERSAPLLGQDNEEIYGRLGFSREQLDELDKQGVI
ncbi:MAG: CoA transferase [Proteobacteria bacterium]|nr:CoA transferase [Pseudomonadota bacterium]